METKRILLLNSEGKKVWVEGKEYDVLSCIDKGINIPTEIAKEIGIHRSYVSKILRSLYAKGLVKWKFHGSLWRNRVYYPTYKKLSKIGMPFVPTIISSALFFIYNTIMFFVFLKEFFSFIFLINSIAWGYIIFLALKEKEEISFD